VTYTTLVEEHS